MTHHLRHLPRYTLCTLAIMTLFAVTARAQPGALAPTMAADPQIAAALQQVSAQRIQANIESSSASGLDSRFLRRIRHRSPQGTELAQRENGSSRNSNGIRKTAAAAWK